MSKPEMPKSSSPKVYQAIVPADHPPYEEPIQMQYGGHFDNSVKHEYAYEEDTPEYTAWSNLDKEFEEIMKSNKIVASIDYVKGVTGAAKYKKAPPTPPFFAITIYEGDDYDLILHILWPLIKKHYPHVSEPIVRFYGGVYSVDF